MNPVPYRPSNGTEGMTFMERFCFQCVRDRNEDCPILANTFAYEVHDAEYPGEWVRDDSGVRCTAFVQEGEPLPTPRCTQTLDMFGETP